MVHLEPLLAANIEIRQSTGEEIIGTEKGDVHSLGKIIAFNMLNTVRKDKSDEFGLDHKNSSIYAYLLSQLGACES